jgi:DNA-binding LytR/AlgR family response regulator
MISSRVEPQINLISKIRKLHHHLSIPEIKNPKNVNLSLQIKANGSYIDTNTILYIRASSNYSTIYLRNGKSIFTSRTLKYWTEEIKQTNFTRIHSSTLINFSAIIEVRRKLGIITYYFDDGSSCECGVRSVFRRAVKELNVALQ